MTGANPGPPACPVCGCPPAPGDTAGPAERSCAECGWTLWTPRRQGPVTESMRSDFERRLGAARRRVDARAAALITDDPGRFAFPGRGGRPSASEWAQVRREAVRSRAGAMDEKPAREGLAELLRGLANGAEAMIVEIGPEGIGLIRATADETGAPRLDRDQPVTPWPDLLPMLSGQPGERMFQLAGGTACLHRAELNASLEEGVTAILDGRAARGTPGSPDPLVICQPAGWTLLEEAARLSQRALGPSRLVRVDGLPAGNGLVGAVAEGLSALRGYGVVVAAVDQLTGTVRLGARPLFHPGDLPGTEARVPLRRLPGDRAPVTLAVAVNGHFDGDEPVTGSSVISTHVLPRPDDPAYELRAVLDAPGLIRFTEPHGVTDAARPWPEVLAAMPGRVDVRPGPVDLLCAIELAGTKRQVDQRRDLVRGLIELIADEYPDAGRESLRVGLLGCTDHVFAPGEEKRRVVRRERLTSPAGVLTALAGFQGEEIRHPAAAPIEDMLHEAYRMLVGSRAAGRTPRLLLVAGRPPHPLRLGPEKVQPCPLNCDWSRLADALVAIGVETVAVADTSPTRTARARFWKQAGRAGLHVLPDTSARLLGEDLGVLARPGHSIGIPLSAAAGAA